MKTKPALLIPLVVATLTLSGCMSPYHADYDPAQDFSRYRTYAWWQGPSEQSDIITGNPLMERRFVQAIDRTLQARGFILTEGKTPDFRVAVHGTTRERLQVNDRYHIGAGYYHPYGGVGVSHVDVTAYEEGTVFIDIIDGRQDQVVWRGWFADRVKNYRDPHQAQAAVNKMVSGILERFPPGE